jgi:hypothetical protein
MTIEEVKTALRELRDGKNNAVAIYVAENLDDPPQLKSPIGDVLRAGYPAQIPYFAPRN